jgi:demethylspheroidene O-methyltransferase
MTKQEIYPQRPMRFRDWWYQKKSQFYASKWVQDISARLPLLSRISRKEGEAIFQLMSGFVDTQILLTFVRTGALDKLRDRPKSIAQLASLIGTDAEAARVLCGAGQALGLVVVRKDQVSIARRGILVLTLPGISELIDHHSVLYSDLQDPVAFFGGQSERQLAHFWPYVFGAKDGLNAEDVSRYSDLMTKSQRMVAQDTLDAITLPKNGSWLDVGGGSGAFISEVLRRQNSIRATVFDLPGSNNGSGAHNFIPGSFFDDDLPSGFDVISLIRVLYDHSDDSITKLLTKVYNALPENGRLIVSEPMLGQNSPNRWGDTYFAIYTMAMNTGKTRSAIEIAEIMKKIGFSNPKIHRSKRPYVTQVIECWKK